MKVYFISDLHIQAATDPLYQPLLKIIGQLQAGDYLVLAGDIFDLFLGSKRNFSCEYIEFIERVRQASERGVQIHYIEGNHDFLMQAAFSRMKNVTVHHSEAVLDLQGRKIYIAHGDLVDRNDYKYRALRAVFRSAPLKVAVSLMPESLAESIGKKLSQHGKTQRPISAERLASPRRDALRQVFRSFAENKIREGFTYVVLGHCHDLDEQEFNNPENTGRYYNLGYPRIHKSYLIWNVDSGKEPQFAIYPEF